MTDRLKPEVPGLIAKAMCMLHPGNWTAKLVHTNGFSLQDDKGRNIFCYVDYKGKVEVSGTYPKDCNGEIPYFSGEDRNLKIGLSLDKSPDKIASDIIKRFLPDYDRVLAVAITRNAAVDKSYAEKNRVKSELEKIAGKVFGKKYSGREGETWDEIYVDNDDKLKAFVTYGGGIKIQVDDLSTKQSLEIVAFLKAWLNDHVSQPTEAG